MQPFEGVGHCSGGLHSHTVQDNLKSCLDICAEDVICKYASYRISDEANCALYGTDTCTLNGAAEYTTFMKSGLYVFVYCKCL